MNRAVSNIALELNPKIDYIDKITIQQLIYKFKEDSFELTELVKYR